MSNTNVFACPHDVDIFYVQSSRSLWEKVRQKIHRGSIEVTRGSPDESENRNDVSDDVEDIELV